MRYLSLLATLVLCLGLAACDGGTDGGNTTPPPAPESTPAPDAEPAPETDADDAGAAVTDAADDAVAVNTECPLSGRAIAAEGKRVSYEGKVYGLCCNGCVDKAKADPSLLAKN